MRRQRLEKIRKRKRRNRRRRLGRYANVILFLSVGGVLFVPGAFASQELSYKGPKGQKELLPDDTNKSTPVQPAKILSQGYVYDPTGKTDPFKSFIAEQESIEEKKKRKPKTYLETLDLSQLDLIAIIVSQKGNWAMVRDSKGIGHVIRKGTPIGLNEGVVYEIKEQELIVREKHKDFRTGKMKDKDTAKKLRTMK
jgi:type IV pilus assembly protein PilP